MSSAIADPELAEFLRLKCCPGCDYSLEGLPPEGLCPECGRCYDQRTAILIGLGRGQYDTLAGGTGKRLVAFPILLLIFAGIRIKMGLRFLEDPNNLTWAIVLAITLGAQLYARFFSPREPRMQLWLSPEGYAQVPSTPEARQAQEFASNAYLLILPLFTVYFMLRFDPRLHPISFTIFVLLAVGSLAFLWHRRRAYRGLGDANYAPALHPWSHLGDFWIETLPNDRARIRCREARYWRKIPIDKPWIVDIEIPCPPAIAVKLRQYPALLRPTPPGK